MGVGVGRGEGACAMDILDPSRVWSTIPLFPLQSALVALSVFNQFNSLVNVRKPQETLVNVTQYFKHVYHSTCS